MQGSAGAFVPDLAAPATAVRRPSRLLYLLTAGGLVAAVAIALTLTRVLGGAAVVPPDDAAAGPARRAAATQAPREVPLLEPAAPAATPVVVPPPATPPDVLPATPPPAVYTPNVPSTSGGYSIPAPVRTRDPPPPVVDRRAAADVRAREQDLRTALARFQRAEAALAAAEGGDPDVEAAAMEQLENAARDLREAESALDRARRRARPRT
jgi:hypothetical protein